MTDLILVLTTVAADEQAEPLARRLVEERLAACVNLLPPMTSVYRWQGQVHLDGERQLIIKTTRDRLTALQDRLGELHAYELPELLILSVEGAGEAYLEWAKQAVH
jgi:periplasmic divalent cation tolerance protein